MINIENLKLGRGSTKPRSPNCSEFRTQISLNKTITGANKRERFWVCWTKFGNMEPEKKMKKDKKNQKPKKVNDEG